MSRGDAGPYGVRMKKPANLDARQRPLPPLPSWNGGRELVDIADREALYEVLDEDDERVRELRRK